MTDRPCRCLITDLPDQAALSRLIRERLAQISPEDRATPEETARRLSRCRDCDALRNGTCGLCGCYVELRAAWAARRCPAVPPRW